MIDIIFLLINPYTPRVTEWVGELSCSFVTHLFGFPFIRHPLYFVGIMGNVVKNCAALTDNRTFQLREGCAFQPPPPLYPTTSTLSQ